MRLKMPEAYPSSSNMRATLHQLCSGLSVIPMTASPRSNNCGRDFAEALARKDFAGIKDLLRPDIDFRGMTPNRIWEAADVDGVDDILQQWFEPSDDLEEIVSIDTDSIADRARVAYRFRVRNPGGRFMVEQQAYYAEQDGQIAWMRIMCSGFRPTGDAAA
jgi:hypothetical protein